MDVRCRVKTGRGGGSCGPCPRNPSEAPRSKSPEHVQLQMPAMGVRSMAVDDRKNFQFRVSRLSEIFTDINGSDPVALYRHPHSYAFLHITPPPPGFASGPGESYIFCSDWTWTTPGMPHHLTTAIMLEIQNRRRASLDPTVESRESDDTPTMRVEQTATRPTRNDISALIAQDLSDASNT